MSRPLPGQTLHLWRSQRPARLGNGAKNGGHYALVLPVLANGPSLQFKQFSDSSVASPCLCSDISQPLQRCLTAVLRFASICRSRTLCEGNVFVEAHALGRVWLEATHLVNSLVEILSSTLLADCTIVLHGLPHLCQLLLGGVPVDTPCIQLICCRTAHKFLALSHKAVGNFSDTSCWIYKRCGSALQSWHTQKQARCNFTRLL